MFTENKNESLTLSMLFREALIDDIPQLQRVRSSVVENALSDSGLISREDYITYLTERGKGWVCEINGTIVGFAIADMAGRNIWALFLHPDFERKGIGRHLHQLMMNWYFQQTDQTVWLSTAPRSRAEDFYRKAGWQETGLYGKGEIKFEMTASKWKNRQLPG